jgi:purine-binding chemotaxis protein CheW
MVSTGVPPADEAVDLAAPPQWVVFSCDGERFAVPLLLSREVVPPQPFTRLPGCGPEVVGLMALQGRAITAFDLGVVIGLRSVLRLPDYRVLVLDVEERVLALAVDAIVGIASEQSALLRPVESELGRLELIRMDVVGMGTLEGERFLALDPNRILSRLLA